MKEAPDTPLALAAGGAAGLLCRCSEASDGGDDSVVGVASRPTLAARLSTRSSSWVMSAMSMTRNWSVQCRGEKI